MNQAITYNIAILRNAFLEVQILFKLIKTRSDMISNSYKNSLILLVAKETNLKFTQLPKIYD